MGGRGMGMMEGRGIVNGGGMMKLRVVVRGQYFTLPGLFHMESME